jgi:hypothetical protein
MWGQRLVRDGLSVGDEPVCDQENVVQLEGPRVYECAYVDDQNGNPG